jgi:hypothetical protein
MKIDIGPAMKKGAWTSSIGRPTIPTIRDHSIVGERYAYLDDYTIAIDICDSIYVRGDRNPHVPYFTMTMAYESNLKSETWLYGRVSGTLEKATLVFTEGRAQTHEGRVGIAISAQAISVRQVITQIGPR